MSSFPLILRWKRHAYLIKFVLPYEFVTSGRKRLLLPVRCIWTALRNNDIDYWVICNNHSCSVNFFFVCGWQLGKGRFLRPPSWAHDLFDVRVQTGKDRKKGNFKIRKTVLLA